MKVLIAGGAPVCRPPAPLAAEEFVNYTKGVYSGRERNRLEEREKYSRIGGLKKNTNSLKPGQREASSC